MDVQKLIEEVKAMTVLELNELVKALEAEFGVSAAVAAAPAEEEKTEFDVVLKEYPADKKIALIKVVKDALGLGLADAKKVVETMGVIKEAAPKADAEALAAKLKENGAVVELK